MCSARHLLDVVAALQPDATVPLPRAVCVRASEPTAVMQNLADVRGQATAKRALEIAATGAHSLLILLCHKSSFALTLPQQGHCPRRAISA